MNKERLQTLADFLKTPLPQEKFDIESWRSGLNTTDRGLRAVSCNTVACAVGWACAIPEFKALGLKYKQGPWTGRPNFKGNDGWDAVTNFFDLRYSDCFYLFDADSYPNAYETTALEVVTRIEEFIANGN